MDSISLGPLLLSTPRVIALLSLLVLLAGGAWYKRRVDARFADWAFNAALTGLVCARLAYVAFNFEAFRSDPLSVLYLWQGGFHPMGAAVGAILYTLWHFRGQWRLLRHATVPLAVAGIAWGSLTMLNQLTATPGKPLPPVNLYDLSGQPQAIEQFRGQPVVLNLWATWCPPCQREMPLLEEMAKANPDVVFLLVNQGETRDQVQGFLDAGGLDIRWVLLDEQFTMGRHFDIAGYPATLFFNAEGEQVERYFGEVSRALLTRNLNRIR
ncbi:hypothetical protein CAI21_04915 [Alkalilimnicola ehrlichii]|uniref:Thioredoxin domain-containing protein n=1 Tax=Alkalilimnicola ehrlichii TaxID=351052 RepID=A0A3E0WY97_9GAMM|nr:TlpA disulfide reductase family protein [Alkalilimnicola ehrlichii]RFA30421.1 hypothetical protein CAI21_04915 [Alkalilimnicola ehrlichii]RFA37974.1 hypothetical protein CAL65_06290 [Alkalilimnicola ehrlichii]